jgi:phospholipase D1/2
MAALAEVARQVMESEKHGSGEDTHSSSMKLTTAAPRRSSAGYVSAPGSPAARTGPPNSFFFPLVPLPDVKGKHRESTEGSHSGSKASNSRGSETPRMVINEEDEPSARLSDPYRNSFVRTESGFRGGWEYEDHDSTGRGTARLWDRQSWLNVDDWNINPRKWLGRSEMDVQEEAGADQHPQPPRQTDSPTPMGGPSRVPSRAPSPTQAVTEEPTTLTVKSSFPRSLSLPHIRHNPAWSRIKSLIPHLAVAAAESTSEQPRSPRDRDVEIIDELTFSGLSVLMLRMWLERDERDERRVPMLLHRLKIRVSDSVNLLNNNSAVFRIECEYANSAAKWVIYRQLRDFNSLHTHYKVTNFYTRNMDLPDFPRAKLGRQNLHRLKKEKGREAGRTEFAKMRREELENYLAGMIKAVVRPLAHGSMPFIHR